MIDEEHKNILKIIDDSIVIDDKDNNNDFGKDIVEISKEVTNDRNIYRFSNTNKRIAFFDSMLGAIGEKPRYNKDVRERYELLANFRKFYHINLSAEDGKMLDTYKEIAYGLLAFRGALEWRAEGVKGEDDNFVSNKKKSGIVDKIRSRF